VDNPNLPTPEPQSDEVDDWETHWERYGAAARYSPANSYRYRLISNILSETPSARVLDVGSGQGELSIQLKKALPNAQIKGIEYSQSGVSRAVAAAKEAGLAIAFSQRDLLKAESIDPEDSHWADVAVCSEVLEHVDEPGVLLANAREYLAPGCRLIITVPGGPRTAFERHIGHRRHYTERALRDLLEESGLVVEEVYRAGFPFFNLYKLIVLLRGKALIADVDRAGEGSTSRLAELILAFFDFAARFNLRSSPFGWQLLAIARSD
jgi:SAM-dependent methyltransferase